MISIIIIVIWLICHDGAKHATENSKNTATTEGRQAEERVYRMKYNEHEWRSHSPN